jgi:hypothetical protein
MPNFIRSIGIGVVGGSIVWACSGADSTQSSNAQGGASGTGGAGGTVVASAGGTSGAGTDHGGSAGSSSNAGDSGGSSSGAGAAGAAGSSAGSSAAGGGGSSSPLACAKNEDCIIATGHSNKGCCYQCSSAYNRNYVATEPCVSADAMSDPVPASCDTGCSLCPASHCQDVHGAACVAQQCTVVNQYGPCFADDDCVVAVDYASQQGGCCSCPEVAPKLLLANDRCVVLKGQPKPDGCAPTPVGICNGLGCPAQCPNPTNLKCVKGACVGT